jgi:hypothetical protein
MATEPRLGRITVKYVPEIDKILVMDHSGKRFYTNSFDMVRKHLKKIQLEFNFEY